MTLKEFAPARSFQTKLPVSGLESHSFAVLVYVVVRDVLGSTANASVTVTVPQRVMQDPEEAAAYADSLLASSSSSLMNGDSEGALLVVGGVASMLNAPTGVQVGCGKKGVCVTRRPCWEAAQPVEPRDIYQVLLTMILTKNDDMSIVISFERLLVF